MKNIGMDADELGSPPHTWRIQNQSLIEARMQRITSTYVENTSYSKVAKAMSEDHLHIRGEYSKQIPL